MNILLARLFVVFRTIICILEGHQNFGNSHGFVLEAIPRIFFCTFSNFPNCNSSVNDWLSLCDSFIRVTFCDFLFWQFHPLGRTCSVLRIHRSSDAYTEAAIWYQW